MRRDRCARIDWGRAAEADQACHSAATTHVGGKCSRYGSLRPPQPTPCAQTIIRLKSEGLRLGVITNNWRNSYTTDDEIESEIHSLERLGRKRLLRTLYKIWHPRVEDKDVDNDELMKWMLGSGH